MACSKETTCGIGTKEIGPMSAQQEKNPPRAFVWITKLPIVTLAEQGFTLFAILFGFYTCSFVGLFYPRGAEYNIQYSQILLLFPIESALHCLFLTEYQVNTC